MPIYLTHKAAIAALIINKILITIPVKYSDFGNVFFKKSAILLLEYTKINIYIIELEKSKQSSYGLIYILGLAMLKNLKTYI